MYNVMRNVQFLILGTVAKLQKKSDYWLPYMCLCFRNEQLGSY